MYLNLVLRSVIDASNYTLNKPRCSQQLPIWELAAGSKD